MQNISQNTPNITEPMEAFKKLCRARSLRVTAQRVEIFKTVFLSKEHPSAETVFQSVRKQLPNISLDTVYRTLASMEQAGVVFRVGLSNKARFDADLTSHYHFVCTHCGEVFDVMPSAQESGPVIPKDIGQIGEVQNINLQFRGLCNGCRQKESKKI